MHVRLIAITKPVIEECRNAPDLLAYCARVSNPGNQSNSQTAPKLVGYLIENKHWSPFEMASMTLEITTTRDIARQILRHRSFSFQEFSQRYAAVESPPIIREARLQDSKNRQSSLENTDRTLSDWWDKAQFELYGACQDVYKRALKLGIAKEVARSVLPEGTTQSVLFMAGTIRSWIHYTDLRAESGTQKEHREIAIACRKILFEQFPDLDRSL